MYQPNTDHQAILETIGLSGAAAQCYLRLVNALPSGMTATNLSQQLFASTSSAYRAVKEFELKGFVFSSRVYKHTVYKAQPLWHALDNYADYQRRVAYPVLQAQHVLQNSPLSGTIRT